jgi:hypothetical protein
MAAHAGHENDKVAQGHMGATRGGLVISFCYESLEVRN